MLYACGSPARCVILFVLKLFVSNLHLTNLDEGLAEPSVWALQTVPLDLVGLLQRLHLLLVLPHRPRCPSLVEVEVVEVEEVEIDVRHLICFKPKLFWADVIQGRN